MSKKGMIWVSRSEITNRQDTTPAVSNGKGNGISNKKTSNYMSQENVKAFNKVFVPRALTGRPYAFESVEKLEKDLGEYFKLCDETNTIPTVTAIGAWLHCDRDTIYNHANNPNSPFFGVLKNTINICHCFLENGAVDGKVNSVLYMFLSKNYFGLKDDKNITVTPATDSVNTPATMEALQKQLNEENVMNAEYEEK